MNQRPQLPEPLRQEIDEILDQSGQAFQAGDIKSALTLAHVVWDLIPEPKAAWDYYPQSLAVAFVEDYADAGDLQASRKWIEITHEVYDNRDRVHHYPLMIEGLALLKLGQQDQATVVFNRIYSLFGQDGFKGEYRAYLKLVKI